MERVEWFPRLTCPYSSSARPDRVRRSSRGRSTRLAPFAAALHPRELRRDPTRVDRLRNCSATKTARLPARLDAPRLVRAGGQRYPAAGRGWGSCRCPASTLAADPARGLSWSASAASSRCSVDVRIVGLWPPTGDLPGMVPKASSARTSGIAWRCFPSLFRRCANGAKTSPRWPGILPAGRPRIWTLSDRPTGGHRAATSFRCPATCESSPR